MYFSNSIFPSDLKVADVTPTFKKRLNTSRDNYRSISILLDISKRSLYNQIQTDFNEILSKYKCGFCKGFSAQHCLVNIMEKWYISIHHRNMQSLATEMLNVKNNIAPEIMKEALLLKRVLTTFVITIQLREGE